MNWLFTPFKSAMLAPIVSLAMIGAAIPAAFAQEVVEDAYVLEDGAQDTVDDDGDEAIVDDDEGEAVVVGESAAVGDGVERCAAEFRSFDPATGTYVTYGGERLPCPYL